MSEQQTSPVRVLLVEDEPGVASFVSSVLRREGAYTVETARTLREALEAAGKQRWDLLVTDLSLPDGDGTRAIELFRRRNPGSGIVVITGFPDEAKVRELEALEINSFLVKPFDTQQLRFSVLGAVEKTRLSVQSDTVSAETDRNSDLGLVGVSAYIRELRERVREIARGKLPVLVTGPSGTGKEIIARGIHECSDRHRQPIFAMNCAAIPRQLEESEFFGYTRGAFTGATTSKKGIIASADGSTLFLDEVGEMSLPVQAKLLRVLDSGEYLRIGDVQPNIVDVRVVSATNRDLETMVKGGTFRQDLFFRLRGGLINTRPLREHIEDLPYLVDHFLRSETGANLPAHITDEALDLLKQHDWPGNVRELRLGVSLLRTGCAGQRRINGAAIRRILKLSSAQLPADEILAPFNVARDTFERSYLMRLLTQTGGNVTAAARTAGIHRPNLIRKLRALGISPADYRNRSRKSRTAK